MRVREEKGHSRTQRKEVIQLRKGGGVGVGKEGKREEGRGSEREERWRRSERGRDRREEGGRKGGGEGERTDIREDGERQREGKGRGRSGGEREAPGVIPTSSPSPPPLAHVFISQFSSLSFFKPQFSSPAQSTDQSPALEQNGNHRASKWIQLL